MLCFLTTRAVTVIRCARLDFPQGSAHRAAGHLALSLSLSLSFSSILPRGFEAKAMIPQRHVVLYEG